MADKKSLTDGEELALENLLLALRPRVKLKVDYTNYRGEKSTRTIHPKRFWVGTTNWHQEECLLLTAFDYDKDADRDFRVADFDLSTAQLG